MNVNSSINTPISRSKQSAAPAQNAAAAEPAEQQQESSSFMDKFVTGVKVAGTSMIPGLGGYGVLRPLAFEVGLNGDPAYKAMDAATLMNYASVPLLATSLVFPRTGLIGAGICLAASGVAGLYGANAAGLFD